MNAKDFFVKNKNTFQIIIFLIILFSIILPCANKFNQKRRLIIYDRGVYSIAKVTEYRNESRSSHYRYSFIYNNKIYKSRSYYKGINLKLGQNYFLIIDPKHPELNNILLQPFPIPDSIAEAPSEGWKELPIPVDKEEIRKFLEEY
ncbi:hypothetical protein [Moheibacter sp.]|uniref:hypothetical protein n=1 Tax=Moheibacter sp. TaxID=1965316 RepID=UPI003C7465A7